MAKSIKSIPNIQTGGTQGWYYWFAQTIPDLLSQKLDSIVSFVTGNFLSVDSNGEAVDSGKSAPTGDIVGTTDSQTLANKTLVKPTISDFTNAVHKHEATTSGGTLSEKALILSDNAINDVLTTKHGFCPKAPNDADKYLNGVGTWSSPSGASPYTLAGTTNQINLSASGTGVLLARDITLSLPQNIDTGASPQFAQVKVPSLKTDSSSPTDMTLITGANKTLLLDSVVYNDLLIPISTGKVSAVNAPTWSTFTGVISQYTFAVDDYIQLSATEFMHDYKEGTPIEIHLHWATNGLNDATVRKVNWSVDYTWANNLAMGGTTAFASPTTVTYEDTIAANQPSLTHRYTTIGTSTPTGSKIGACILIRVKRIAKTAGGSDPANNPFAIMTGIHYQCDTIGSRQEYIK